LDLAILKLLHDDKSLEEISRLLKVEPLTLGQTIARLQVEGYLTPEGSLSEKGLQALQAGERGRDSPRP
jgi:Mn-dependent DtxR family transcriptional regulator